MVQFKIFSVPTGGSPVWAGEVHRTTVNGGLVNVMLGTKTPLNGVDFNQQLYLEITVDVSGPGGQPDGAITEADPPMLPRQAILPVVFAKEAENSRKLNGGDWSAVFGTNDPINGKIPGAKIGNGQIGANHLAINSVSSSAILDQAIQSVDIADGEVRTRNLADNGVTANKIADGSVTLPKLATRIVGTNVPVAASRSVTPVALLSGAWPRKPISRIWWFLSPPRAGLSSWV